MVGGVGGAGGAETDNDVLLPIAAPSRPSSNGSLVAILCYVRFVSAPRPAWSGVWHFRVFFVAGVVYDFLLLYYSTS